MMTKKIKFNISGTSTTYDSIVDDVRSCGGTVQIESWHPADFHIYVLIQYVHLAEYEDFLRKFSKTECYELIEVG